MHLNSPVPAKDQKEKPKFLVQVGNVEKLLWSNIYSRGLLQPDVKDLYRKACLSYEKIILSEREQAELQEAEYLLWKLHYKHIDEYRKKIKRSSADSGCVTSGIQQSRDNHIEGLKSFLFEATDFYQSLIVKSQKFYGPLEEFSPCRKNAKEKQKFQTLCHRFFVCLGDLARYREQYEKLGVQNHNWSVAATHYLEATMICPDSGNPQNQLAVLATYVGDDFLALYHCVRSLAVKEPFPDAWNNLILLFERNRLSDGPREAHFDFANPSERISVRINLQSSVDISDSVHTNLWSLTVRMLSFFFINSSLEDFPCAFASTTIELDAVMNLDDTKLAGMLESYQLMDSARKGPFRALQVVLIFIFIFHNLTSITETKGSQDKTTTTQQVELTRLALIASFIFMGRVVDRCVKANPSNACPLLPATLVFVEWLEIVLDKVESYVVDDRVTRAMSYFFGAFVNLLKQLNGEGKSSCPESTALWEDFELRGFAPIALRHTSLDFSTRIEGFNGGTEYRAQRVIRAAIKMANRPEGARKWIICDKSGREFYTEESNGIQDTKQSEKTEFIGKKADVTFVDATKLPENPSLDENGSNHSMNGKGVAIEDEEVILFKPLVRYNSAPLYPSVSTKDAWPPKPMEDQTVASDECLRRATSVLMAQNQDRSSDPLAFHAGISNFKGNKLCKPHEPPSIKDITPNTCSGSSPISAGPPSLSGWVINGGDESFNIDRDKGRKNFNKHNNLSSIPEIDSTSLNGLSIHENEDRMDSSTNFNHYFPPRYSVPVPSAPLLPEYAPWFNNTAVSNYSEDINLINTFYNPPQILNYSNWTASRDPLNYTSSSPDFTGAYPPFRGMSSSEWLRQYRENNNPEHANPPRSPQNFSNLDSSKIGLLDRYGTPPNPTLYNMEEISTPSTFYPRNEKKLINEYQRPRPYGCGGLTDLRNEPQPLLQYRKEKEWIVQRDPTTFRGPTYMGN